ncbi:MAG: hypothetical protein ACO1RX_09020, partial [Candidatus Sericytochromatia bacterium]
FNLNFVGSTIPSVVAQFLTPRRMALIFEVVVEGVQWAQSELQQAPPEVRKKEAYEFILKSYVLFRDIFGHHPLIDQYVRQNLLPSMIDGVMTAFNLALWFDSSKPIAVGGTNNPVPPSGLAQIPGPIPPIQPDAAALAVPGGQ